MDLLMWKKFIVDFDGSSFSGDKSQIIVNIDSDCKFLRGLKEKGKI